MSSTQTTPTIAHGASCDIFCRVEIPIGARVEVSRRGVRQPAADGVVVRHFRGDCVVKSELGATCAFTRSETVMVGA